MTYISSRASIGRASEEFVTNEQMPNPFYRAVGKRLLDLSIVLISAPAVLLIVAILAFMVSLDGGKPFYRQIRVGRHGKPYHMWKLRSMVSDADEKLASYLRSNSDAREEWNRSQKLRHDPRITPFGQFLRKTSLDELPQLWNVFRGDMSLVGPRPMMECQRTLYPGLDYYYLRPGITGPWQVSSRNETSFAERASFDAFYHRNISLKTDVKLLLATTAVVVRATGH